MAVTVSVTLLLATATLFQFAHCVPTHRLVRRVQEIIPSYESQSEIASDGEASELQSSAVARDDGSNPSNMIPSTSSFQSYVPSQFSQYQNQLNFSQFSNQYPNQFPSQFNPNQFNPSNFGPAAPSAAPPAAPSADELQPSVKEGGSTSSSAIPSPSSFQSYVPSQFSQFNPNQLSGQYPSQFPSQFNPSNFGSSAAAPAAAASEPQPSVAAREGESASSSAIPSPSSFQNYVPSQFSQFNPSQLSGQYPSQFPSQFNPSNFGGAAPVI